ncbi:MAG: copper chaperone PCu(A)C [Anaerolineales bacterium]|nr:MAG: copper chaperone PCu(A)C [Anaerolineales bacterium]
MKKHYVAVLVVLAVALAACNNAGGRWHTHEAYSRPTLAGGTGATYFMLHNATETDDALIGASSDVAETVEIHLSGMVADGEAVESQQAAHDEHGEAGHAEGEHPMGETEMHDMSSIGTMVKVDRVELAASHEIAFAPGGYHIMLINLQRELSAGDTFELTLHFEHAEDLTIEVKVLAP